MKEQIKFSVKNIDQFEMHTHFFVLFEAFLCESIEKLFNELLLLAPKLLTHYKPGVYFNLFILII